MITETVKMLAKAADAAFEVVQASLGIDFRFQESVNCTKELRRALGIDFAIRNGLDFNFAQQFGKLVAREGDKYSRYCGIPF
jgi:hypothetical protein